MSGLYINTNVSSLQSQNALRRNMSGLSEVLTRLSTGLRINSGKDDPAGMIASELIRSDITGTTMAIRNTQRANSVLSIAESALGQVSMLLNDVRGLINEAANDGAMTADMISANQLQIDASLDSIDRIARTTNFMGKSILDGSLDFVTANANAKQTDFLRIDAANFGTSSKVSVNIDVVKDADNARLFFVQAGVSQQTVLEIAGNRGSEVFNFQSGATITDIARGVNLVSDATGVRAILGQEATKGQILATSAGGGVNNDINIKAVDAGFMQGNYSIKFSAGTGAKSNYTISSATANQPGVIDIQLAMEEAQGASAHAINTYFDIKAKQPGTMFNDTDVIFVDGGAGAGTSVSFEKGPKSATGMITENGADNNVLHLAATKAGTSFNGVDIQYTRDASLATAAGASYDANAKILTIAVRDGNTTYADINAALKANTDFSLTDVKTTANATVDFATKIGGAGGTAPASSLFLNAIGSTAATMGTDSNALVVMYEENMTTLKEIADAINDYTNTNPNIAPTGALFEAKLVHVADANLVVRTQTAEATITLAAGGGTDETFSFDYSRMTTSSGKLVNGLLDGMKIELFDGTLGTTPGDRYNYATNTVFIDIGTAPPVASSGVLAKRLEAILNGQRINGQPAGETLRIASGAIMTSPPQTDSTAILLLNGAVNTPTTFTFDYDPANAPASITTSSGASAAGILDGIKIELFDGLNPLNTPGNRYDLNTNTVFLDITTLPAPADSDAIALRLITVLNGKHIAGQLPGETINVPALSITGPAVAVNVVAGDVGKSAYANSGTAVAAAADDGAFTYINTGVATKFQGDSTFTKILQGGSCGYVSKLTANEVIDFINSSEELSRLIKAENAFGSNGLAKVTTFDEAAYYGHPNTDNALQFLGATGSTNIVFTANAPGQPLSIGFISADTKQPAANLVATNADAAFSITAFQKGSLYDDVAVRFIASSGTDSVTYTNCPSSAMAYVSLNPSGSLGTNHGIIVNAKTPGAEYNMTDIVFKLDVNQNVPAKAAYDKDLKRLVVTVNSNSGTPYSNQAPVTTNDIIAAINATAEFSAELDYSGGTNTGLGYTSLMFPAPDAVATVALASGDAKITFSKSIVDTAGNSSVALLNNMNIAIGAANNTVAYNMASHTLTIGTLATAADIATYLNNAATQIKGMPVGEHLSGVTAANITLSANWIPVVGDAGGIAKVGTTTTEVIAGNTGETGGHKGGTIEFRLQSNTDGNAVLTSSDLIDMINDDSIVSQFFSAASYVGSTGAGLVNFHTDTIRNITGGDGKSYPATVMKTAGGVIGEDLMEIKLATDKNGNVITTARDLVAFMNTLDAETTRGISVSLVYPQGVDNLLRTWETDSCGNIIESQSCVNPYGYGLLSPTVFTDDCGNKYYTPIEFQTFGEKTTPAKPWGEVVAVNGLDASFRLYASIPGAEYEGVTLQYYTTSGSGGNEPRAEYDVASKKLSVFIAAGSTAATVAQLIRTSDQTKNLFFVEQLGTGNGIVTESDDSVSLKHGTYNAGYRGGAMLLGAGDADAHKLIFESIDQGSEQRVDVRVINGVFDTYNASGTKSTRDFGDDMIARLNGLTMVARGRDLSINTASLSLALRASSQVTTGDTIAFDIASGGATFQIGPDVVSSQQIRVGIQSVNTARLGGASGRLMMLRAGESASLSNNVKLADLIVQEAINSVAILRGRIGTIQRSTLDPNMAVLQDTLVEMSAAEAQISNADFAEESAKLTRAQILVQSGAKTLSIANQLPQYAAMLMG